MKFSPWQQNTAAVTSVATDTSTNPMNQIQLSVEESLALAKEQSFWEGYAAGARDTAERAKHTAIEKVAASKTQQTKPTPEASNVPTE